MEKTTESQSSIALSEYNIWTEAAPRLQKNEDFPDFDPNITSAVPPPREERESK